MDRWKEGTVTKFFKYYERERERERERTKVKACKSFLFKEGSLKVESRKHLFDFVVTLYFNSLCSNALGSNKVYQQFENEEIISQLC